MVKGWRIIVGARRKKKEGIVHITRIIFPFVCHCGYSHSIPTVCHWQRLALWLLSQPFSLFRVVLNHATLTFLLNFCFNILTFLLSKFQKRYNTTWAWWLVAHFLSWSMSYGTNRLCEVIFDQNKVPDYTRLHWSDVYVDKHFSRLVEAWLILLLFDFVFFST